VRQVKLFLGAEHPCSYLPGQVSRSAYVDTDEWLDVAAYSSLAAQGLRRSGDLVYRPLCRSCLACVPIRIPVARFLPNRSQLRTLRDNQDLTATPKPAAFDEEHYRLFRSYLAARHADGGMANSTPQDYIGFLGSSWADTWFVEFRLQETLVAVAVVDRLSTGMSAVYTFFNPAHAERGLGTLAVLWQIEESKRLGLDWLYLGFWVGACRKMRYKGNYRPLEAMVGGHWLPFEKGEKIDI
jgi:arginyl-tRNA--protein-N-Asp/Glu arginylyltransferase